MDCPAALPPEATLELPPDEELLELEDDSDGWELLSPEELLASASIRLRSSSSFLLRSSSSRRFLSSSSNFLIWAVCCLILVL